LATHAVITFLAGREERNNDLIANVKAFDVISFLHNLTNKLMPADKARGAFQVAAIEVQVRALGTGEFTWRDWNRGCVLTQSAVDVTFSTASVGFRICG